MMLHIKDFVHERQQQVHNFILKNILYMAEPSLHFHINIMRMSIKYTNMFSVKKVE